MSAIGTLLFCKDCGNLLDSSTGNEKTILTCECCGAENKGTMTNDLFVDKNVN
jgi:DNA-directed RNA polymerase I subunit RPA12